jgi:hypothetical protein
MTALVHSCRREYLASLSENSSRVDSRPTIQADVLPTDLIFERDNLHEEATCKVEYLCDRIQ